MLQVEEEFSSVCDASRPCDCVVVGDAMDSFSYQRLNAAFSLLLGGGSVRLFSLGMGCVSLELGATFGAASLVIHKI